MSIGFNWSIGSIGSVELKSSSSIRSDETVRSNESDGSVGFVGLKFPIGAWGPIYGFIGFNGRPCSMRPMDLSSSLGQLSLIQWAYRVMHPMSSLSPIGSMSPVGWMGL